jgi:hypothetical protein
VQKVYPLDGDLEDDFDAGRQSTATVIGGVVLLGFGGIPLVLFGSTTAACADGDTCNSSRWGGLLFFGIVFLVLGLWALASQFDLRPHGRGF